jgi:sugar phosphate isomerase/epimerase
MKCALASWDFQYAGPSLAEHVAWMADAGLEAVSFDPCAQRELLDGGVLREVAAEVGRRNLPVTLHGSALIAPAEVAQLAEALGSRLLNVTMNPAAWHDSRGILIDAKRCGQRMREIEAITRGTQIRIGIEDYPRDRLALEFYREHLAGLLQCERFGTLIDLGHMNYWLQTQAYYKDRGITIEKYLAGVPVPIWEVHVHDNDGTRDGHLALGEGNFDVDAAARGLAAIGFDRIATFEIGGLARGEAPELARRKGLESVRRWRQAVAKRA